MVAAAAALGGYAARRVTPAPSPTVPQAPSRDPFALALEALHAGHVTDAAERF